MAGGYAKVFASLWQGTLGVQWEAWSVFVYMLANCDAQGRFDQTPEILATRSGLPLEIVEKGLRVLEQPDRRSRRAIENGRRIMRLDEHRDWGWKIVNHDFYRGSMDDDERREKDRIRQQKHRQIVAAQKASREVTNGHASSRQAEAEAEAKAEALELLEKPESTCLDREHEQTLNVLAAKNAAQTGWRGHFTAFWTKYPHWRRRSSRARAFTAWCAIQPRSSAMLKAIMDGLDAAIASPDWQKDGGEFVPAAERWLRKRGWDSSDGKIPITARGEGTNGYDYAAYNAYRTKALEESGRFMSPEEWNRSRKA